MKEYRCWRELTEFEKSVILYKARCNEGGAYEYVNLDILGQKYLKLLALKNNITGQLESMGIYENIFYEQEFNGDDVRNNESCFVVAFESHNIDTFKLLMSLNFGGFFLIAGPELLIQMASYLQRVKLDMYRVNEVNDETSFKFEVHNLNQCGEDAECRHFNTLFDINLIKMTLDNWYENFCSDAGHQFFKTWTNMFYDNELYMTSLQNAADYYGDELFIFQKQDQEIEIVNFLKF